jgi:formiminotetrahydrofolate cyclodeaminase
MYIDKPLKTYLEDLAAKQPTPGGGSAAALSAAIGVSLMTMSANYTKDNPRYKDCEKKIADILVRCENYRSELESLIDEDIEAYGKLSDGLKKAGKGKDLPDSLYKEAARVPFDVCKISAECLELCKVLAECGAKGLVTDVAIAAILLEGAFFSAKFNVYLNLKPVKDTDHVAKIHGILAPMEEKLPALKEEVIEACEEVIE